MDKRRFRLSTMIVIMCMIVTMIGFIGCGKEEPAAQSGSDSGEPEAAEEVAVEEEPEAEPEPVDPNEKYYGTWLAAAAEYNGVTLGGNFADVVGMEELPSLVVKEDGSGTIDIGEGEIAGTWTATDDAITLTTETPIEKYDTNEVVFRSQDDVLLMDYTDEGRMASLIYTRDGNYDKARQIEVDKADAITSEDELIGNWTMVGMNMMGISMYGSSESLAEMNDGMETYMNFNEDKTVDMNGNAGVWEIGAEGAGVTMEDITGLNTYPVKKLGDEIIVDMSASMGGNTFVILLEKK